MQVPARMLPVAAAVLVALVVSGCGGGGGGGGGGFLNLPPTAADVTYNVNEDTPVVALFPASDPNGTILSFTITVAPASGVVVVTGVGFVYTPTLNFNGTDTFTYQASDGLVTATGVVTVNLAPVNDPPIAVADAVVTQEDTPLLGIPVVANDIEPEGDAFNVVGVTAPANGTAVVVGNTIDYTPNLNFNGTDTFTYTVADVPAGATSVGTVTVTVTPVNDVPTINNPGVQFGLEDSPKAIVNLSVADVDVNEGAGVLEVFLQVQNPPPNGGTLTLPVAGLTFSLGDGSADTQMRFQGTLAAVNAALNGLVYTPSPNYFGLDGIQMSVSDLGSTGAGGVQIVNGTVPVNVQSVNDPPVLGFMAKTVDESATSVLTALDISASDIDHGPAQLTFTLVTAPSLGTLRLSLAPLGIGGTFTMDDVNNARVDYLHGGAELTTDIFGFTVQDAGAPPLIAGPATFTFTINPVNDFPVITVPGAPPSLPENTNSALTGISVTDADAGVGVMVVTVSAQNGTLTIPGVNPDVGGNGSFNLTITAPQSTVNTRLANLFYLPLPGFSATDTITVNANDQGASGAPGPRISVQNFNVNVTGNNDPPLLTPPAATSTQASNPVVIPYALSDPDVGGGNIQVGLSVVPDGNLTVPAPPGLVISGGTNGSGAFTITGVLADVLTALFGLTYQLPTGNPLGFKTVTALADDLGNTGAGGAMTDTKNVVVEVKAFGAPKPVLGGAVAGLVVAPNARPEARNDSVRVPPGVSVSVPVLLNDRDPDGDPLRVDEVLAPGYGTASAPGDGTVHYEPSAGFLGLDRVPYLVADGRGGLALASLFVTVSDFAGTLFPARVSLGAAGAEGTGPSLLDSPAASSADGAVVAFASAAEDLVPGDVNGVVDVFVHDRRSGETTLISQSTDGWPAELDCRDPALSSEGRLVAFTSRASVLVAGDTNGAADVFLHDRLTGTTSRISRDGGGGQLSTDSLRPRLSHDGRFVLFDSAAPELGGDGTTPRTFVHDRADGSVRAYDLFLGGPAACAAGLCRDPVASADWRTVAFVSDQDTLVAGDTNGVDDVFVWDRTTGVVERASESTGGLQADGPSGAPSLSADGSFVAFVSAATNLSGADGNGRADVFVRDRVAGRTTRVNEAAAGGDSGAGCVGEPCVGGPSLSGDGRTVAFHAGADDLLPGDGNGVADTFVLPNPLAP